jgi:hypothetical protein
MATRMLPVVTPEVSVPTTGTSSSTVVGNSRKRKLFEENNNDATNKTSNKASKKTSAPKGKSVVAKKGAPNRASDKQKLRKLEKNWDRATKARSIEKTSANI